MKNNIGIKQSNGKFGFTLAEMMVVMLILSIVMAAFAPVMTRKSKVDLSSPWKWVEGTGDIKFASGNSRQMVIIGKLNRTEGSSGRLVINTDTTVAKNHLLFEVGGNNAGVLRSTASTFDGSGNVTTPGSILIGYMAGDINSTGDLEGSSVAIGHNVKSVENSVAVGANALSSNDDGSGNTAIGYKALSANTAGSSNVAVGSNALVAATTGGNNTAVGTGAASGITTGSENVAYGYHALKDTTSGNYNSALGVEAISSNESGSYISALGYQACSNVTGSNKTCIGKGSGPSSGSTEAGDASEVIYLGTTAGKVRAPHDLVVSNELSLIPNGGTEKFKVDSYGDMTLARVLNVNNTTTTASKIKGNLEVGDNMTVESSLTVKNSLSVRNTLSVNAVNIGSGGLKVTNTTAPTNLKNTVIEGDLTVKGSISATGTITAGGNISTGTGTISAANLNAGSITAGNISASGNINAGGNINASGTITGNPGPEAFNGYGADRIAYSDLRLKNILEENNDGLDKIRELKVYNFTFKKDKKKLPHVGIIAQELQKVFPNAVVENEDGYLMIRWDEMFFAMINSIKELALKLDKHDEEIQQLRAENAELKARLEVLEQAVLKN